MRAEYPDSLDDFRLPLTRDEYNAGITEDRPLSPLRFAYILNELERHMVELDEQQASQDIEIAGADKRLKTVEEELDAIALDFYTKRVTVADEVRIGEFGPLDSGVPLWIKKALTNQLVFLVTQLGNTATSHARGEVQTDVDISIMAFSPVHANAGVVALISDEAYEAMWLQSPTPILLKPFSVERLRVDASGIKVTGNALVEGPDGYNAANEEAALYLGDTNVALRARYGSGFRMNVAGVADALQVDENTGDAHIKSDLNVPTAKGVKVNGVRVISDQQESVAAPTAPTFGGPESGGFGWKDSAEMQDWIDALSQLITDFTDLRDKLAAHGLIAL